KLNANPIPIQIPIGAEEKFKGVVDLINMRGIVWDDDTQGMEYDEIDIPEDLQETAEKYRKIMLENIADHDDELMEKYLLEEESSAEEIEAAIREATLDRSITPVMLGSALRNKGVQIVLDKVIKYLPSPYDIPPVQGKNPDNHEEKLERKPSVQE